jgi:hypothetical protein
MRMYISIFLVLLLVNAGTLLAQDTSSAKMPTIFAGLRFQKAIGFYWTNGISAEFKSPRIFKQTVSLGFNFVSSLFGSAIGSNAIPYSDFNLSATKYFRNEKPLKPLVRLNLGFARAYLDEYYGIPERSATVSVEGGIAYDFKKPFRITASFGYNVITGNGMKGLGVLFPLYAQCSVFYRIPVKQKWINLLR